MSRVEVITLSYAGDYEMCRALCESVDRFVADDVVHRLCVPHSDLSLFSQLASSRRTVEAQDRYLPWWFFKMPLPSPRWRKLLCLPRRNVYLTPFSLPVRGWITQQIIKIAVAIRSQAEIVLHMDSDAMFIRPLKEENLTRGGLVRIYRDPVSSGLESHEKWQRAAGRLLGLPSKGFYGAEYIDTCLVWRTSVLRGMIERLEAVSGADWITTLARTPHFAEYVLYGVYADRIVGLNKAGLREEAFSLCLSRWTGSLETAEAVEAFVDEVQPFHVACNIQSTISGDMEQRKRIIALVADRAAWQDRSVETA